MGSTLDVEKTVVGKSNRIFIVHGHDEEMKQAVALTLRKLDIEPIILNEKPYLGKTIIEKFTHYADVPFAVVLLSPDDMVYHKDGSREIVAIRARQNVIFELGFFIGKLGRERVLVLHSEGKNFEMLSDYSGVVYIPYNETGKWELDVVKELKACGFGVDANKLFS